MEENTASSAAPAAAPAADKPVVHTLEAIDLHKVYRKKEVVRGVSIHIDKGEVVGLLGPNGAGKTTSFYMMLGLVRPTAGKVLFNGKDVTHEPVYKRARAGLGYLAQEPSIFRGMSVEDNVLAILETTKLSRHDRRVRCDELLNRFDLAKVRTQKAMSLSGGERRKLEIARALVQNPAVLMLDEPFAGIDPKNVAEIRTVVKELSSEGYGVLITDHNARETLLSVERAYLLKDGVIRFEGTPEEMLANEGARRDYFTEDFHL